MSKYKVITIAMAVKNNRIAKFGETVDDSELTTNPSALIEEGFLEEVTSDDKTEIVETVDDSENLEEEPKATKKSSDKK